MGAKISPLNTVNKQNSDEKRVILNLSHPYNRGSVNQGISKEEYLGQAIELKYPKVDSLVKIVLKKGKGSLLFKKDLKRAYRWINVDFGDIFWGIKSKISITLT